MIALLYEQALAISALNKTGRVCVNVTLRRVRVIFVAMELHILSVCL